MRVPRGGRIDPEVREAVSEVVDTEIPASVLLPMITAAEERWPDLKVNTRAFSSFLLARRPVDAPPGSFEWLAGLHVVDLWLTSASLAGDPRAIAMLEEVSGPIAREVASRHKWCSSHPDDVRRGLLRALLVAESDKTPKLAQYSGRGPLTSFLRVCAIRMALNEENAGARLAPLDDVGLAERAIGSGGDEELNRLKDIYRPVFETVVQEVLADRDARDRNLLRLHHLERLPCERIAALYKVHTSTVWRWIEKAHRELRSEILRRLALRLGTEIPEAESILRLVWSHIDDSVRVALGDDKP